MKLWYNKTMKILVKLLLLFILLASSVNATTFDVLVLPVDLLQTKENYYAFDEVSEIISNDIIYNFQHSGGKINSPDLYTVRTKLNQDAQAKQFAQKALSKYKNNNNIDYDAFKNLSNIFNCKSTLIVSASAVTNKNSLKRSVWEILEISTAFEITYPYRLEISLVLLDNVNNLVMWSNNYSYKLGANDNIFAAKNYAQANGEYEKIKLYSKTIVAPSAAQNIALRFFPKSIKPVETKVQDTGGALRYDSRSIPRMKRDDSKDIPYTDDMIYDF